MRMLLVLLYRVCRFAWQGFWRNFWLSMVTITIMALAALTVNTLIGLNVVIDSATQCLEKKIDMSVYFDPEVDEPKVIEVKNYLEKLAQVGSVKYVSAAQALQDFRLRHAKDTSILESIEEMAGNPLGATLVVNAHRPDDYPTIVQIIKNSPYRDLVAEENYKDHRQTISEISNVAGRVNRTGVALSVVFILIATLIVFNTIRVAIYTHREEIGIMKLVGASNTFITAPFVIESVFYALCTILLTIVVTFPMLNAVQPYLQNFFTCSPLNLVKYFTDNFTVIVGTQLGGVIALNIIGSSIAIRRYLKV